MILKALFRVCLIIVIFFSCSPKKERENEITVFCASSLSPVLFQIKDNWEKDRNVKIVINSASSGTLARQIENGAQADIYISANKEWMQYLIKVLKSAQTPKDIASNQIVVIVPVGLQFDSMRFENLLTEIAFTKGMIALGDPNHVPLGKYTKESLDFYGAYASLADRFILCKDARSTLRLVALGEATMGFVYLSDALTSEEVRIVTVIPDSSHQTMVYESLLMSADNPDAEKFYQYLASSETTVFWEKYGFKAVGN